ncbi:MAG TPA: hypothetical protein VIY08_09000 [Candidatus Nitrosocosmicus sp.]
MKSERKVILSSSISKEQTMFVTEHFLSDIVKKYGQHLISTGGDT